MSSVAITGGATGSGVITLLAPITNTDSTITLPDETGTAVTTGSTAVVSQAMLATNVASNGPAFLATQTSGQSISNSTFTKLQFNTEIFDTNNNYDSSTNYRFTATIAGYYQINANFAFNGNSSGFVQAQIYKNGAVIIDGSGTSNNTTIGGKGNAAGVVYLAVNDYIEYFVWQSSGGALTLQSGAGANTFSGAMVRAA